jgi:hypothetical protein
LAQKSNPRSTRGFLLFFERLTLDLEEYAEWDFKLSIPDKDGVTEREHLVQVEEQTGRTPLSLIGPDFPEEIAHVWSAFLFLNNTRGQGFNGPIPIAYQEIEAWIKLTNNKLLSWEIEMVKKIDAVYVRVVNNKR